jgi:hypothetical protein
MKMLRRTVIKSSYNWTSRICNSTGLVRHVYMSQCWFSRLCASYRASYNDHDKWRSMNWRRIWGNSYSWRQI